MMSFMMREKRALQGGTLRIRVMIVVIPDQERGGVDRLGLCRSVGDDGF